jgi:hypothetical protein
MWSLFFVAYISLRRDLIRRRSIHPTLGPVWDADWLSSTARLCEETYPSHVHLPIPAESQPTWPRRRYFLIITTGQLIGTVITKFPKQLFGIIDSAEI